MAPVQAIYLLTTGAREAAFRNIKTIAECLADELINAAKGSSNRCCIATGTWHMLCNKNCCSAVAYPLVEAGCDAANCVLLQLRNQEEG